MSLKIYHLFTMLCILFTTNISLMAAAGNPNACPLQVNVLSQSQRIQWLARMQQYYTDPMVRPTITPEQQERQKQEEIKQWTNNRKERMIVNAHLYLKDLLTEKENNPKYFTQKSEYHTKRIKNMLEDIARLTAFCDDNPIPKNAKIFPASRTDLVITLPISQPITFRRTEPLAITPPPQPETVTKSSARRKRSTPTELQAWAQYLAMHMGAQVNQSTIKVKTKKTQ